MMRRSLIAGLTACLIAIVPTCSLPAQAPTTAITADFSGIDAFYAVADILHRDADPTPADWNRFWSNPAYRLLAQIIAKPEFEDACSVALKPSNAQRRDFALSHLSNGSLVVQHLKNAYDQRALIYRTRDLLEATLPDSVARAVINAERFLPPSFAGSSPTLPVIRFALFTDDGFALQDMLLDPLNVADHGLVMLVSHEMHHMFLARYDQAPEWVITRNSAYDHEFALALRNLRNEGIADQIDKPHPLPPYSKELAFYSDRYNEEYGKTPITLRTIDSLLVVVHNDSTKGAAAGRVARQLLWSNSHPAGAYITRTIIETFGVDSIFPALSNPFALLRTYASAVVKRGGSSPWSAAALGQIADIERRYLLLSAAPPTRRSGQSSFENESRHHGGRR